MPFLVDSKRGNYRYFITTFHKNSANCRYNSNKLGYFGEPYDFGWCKNNIVDGNVISQF